MSDWQNISALIDNEVSPEERVEIEAKISKSPELQAHYESALALKSAVKRTCPGIDCEVTWKACQGRLNEIDKTQKVNNFVGRYAWAICSVFFLMIFGAAMFNRMTGYKTIRSGDIAQMVSGLAPVTLPTRSNSEEMTKWFADQMAGKTVPIKSNSLNIVHAARGKVNGHPILYLDMKDQTGPVSLAIVQDAHEVEGTSQVDGSPKYFAGKNGNLNFLTWSEGEFSLLLLSPRPVFDLLPIADAVSVRPH